MKAQPLTKAEMKALLAACGDCDTGVRDRAYLTALWRGSMRSAAPLRVMPSELDWERNMILLRDDKCESGRWVVLDEQAMAIQRIWFERRNSLGLNGHHPFYCSIYQPNRGNALSTAHFRRRIKVLAEKAGIEKRVHLHALRHTGASEMAEEGLPIATISRQLGHKSAAVTSRYLHELRPDLADSRLAGRTW